MLTKNKKSPKILLRSPNWVGDAVMATPVVRALKGTEPNCRIHVLAKAWVAPVWENHPEVERVMVMNPKRRRLGPWRWLQLVFRLRQERYDLGLVLPNSFSSAWLQWCAGVRQRVGYAADNRRWLLTVALPWQGGVRTLPRPQIYLNLARAAGSDVDLCQEWNFFIKATPAELGRADALLGPKPGGLRIGLATGSVGPSRRWGQERFAQLADRLAAQGHQVVLVGSKKDYEIAQRVARRTQSKPLITAGKTSLRDGLAVIKRLDLLVSNDTGAMHMAYAQGIPVLVLHGPGDPRVSGPFGAKSAYLRDDSLKCVPCVRNECPTQKECMQGITVDQVWDKVQAMLAGRREKAEKNSCDKRP